MNSTIRSTIVAIGLLLGTCLPAAAQVSVNIGINLRTYPDLVLVPGYPVYYAPGLNANFFFYDGLYWVYDEDGWYSSDWYDGPWEYVPPEYVPYFILRVPVRYYRQPPPYFRAWIASAPPRWGERWGRSWEQRRTGWDRWDRASVPAPAPLPIYQRSYSGDRYPRADQRQILRSQNYRYQPRESFVRSKFQQPPVQVAPAQRPAQNEPAPRNNTQPRDARPRDAPTSSSPRVFAPPQPQSERTAPPQPENRGAERREDRSERGSPPREAASPRAREQSGPPQVDDKADSRGQKPKRNDREDREDKEDKKDDRGRDR